MISTERAESWVLTQSLSDSALSKFGWQKIPSLSWERWAIDGIGHATIVGHHEHAHTHTHTSHTHLYQEA